MWFSASSRRNLCSIPLSVEVMQRGFLHWITFVSRSGSFICFLLWSLLSLIILTVILGSTKPIKSKSKSIIWSILIMSFFPYLPLLAFWIIAMLQSSLSSLSRLYMARDFPASIWSRTIPVVRNYADYMPESYVLLYELNGLDWIAFRPSGTEPLKSPKQRYRLQG